MKFREFSVKPNLPEKLKPLLELAYNLWWVWEPEAFSLYRDIDPDLWSDVSHNPVSFMYQADQDILNELADDAAFLNRIETVTKRLEDYMKKPTWFDKVKNGLPENFLITYFSLEFGLAECLPIYSGGLGVLAGDHLKSASDLGLPLKAVGLLYNQGYFHQYLTNDGWQQERYIINDYNVSPVSIVNGSNGSPLKLELNIGGETVKFRVWKAQVGRIELFLLDTNLPENSEEIKKITSRLYGGDLEMRIKQEFLLGIGGMTALTAMGLKPTVTHMNEGHSSFLALERTRLYMQENKLSFDEAKEIVAASSIFTTHTPVPAGNDRFPKDLMERYLKGYVEHNLKISFNDFLKLGKVYPDDEKEWFCMTVLALKLSHFNNGVSKLHGHVSRGMWKDIWPGVPRDEVPITHITNGIHANSWISRETADLFARYLGSRWTDNPDDQEVWERIMEIPDTELWRTHERRKERLVGFVRKKLKKQLKERNAPAEVIGRADEVLSPDALTIGFARRFATYKRATLLFKDIERIKKILNNKDMPVQIIFAGKAHPKDDAGKEFIKRVFKTAESESFQDKLVFVEDYDLNTAHYLVQGVDIWLNNPIRPLEASGTSGMKVIFNGGINFSVSDGWWAERPDAENGWCIGRGEEYNDPKYRDEVEANSIYETLEDEIIPLYYKRGKDNQPHDWIAKMKTSMATLCPVFNTHRMVMEYTEKFYKPGGIHYAGLSGNGYEAAKNISRWKKKVSEKWNGVKINEIVSESGQEVKVGEGIKVQALVDGAGLSHEDLLVEIYYGFDRAGSELADVSNVEMNFKETKDNLFVYEGEIKPDSSGKVSYTIRALPKNPALPVKFLPGYIKWSEI